MTGCSVLDAGSVGELLQAGDGEIGLSVGGMGRSRARFSKAAIHPDIGEAECFCWDDVVKNALRAVQDLVLGKVDLIESAFRGPAKLDESRSNHHRRTADASAAMDAYLFAGLDPFRELEHELCKALAVRWHGTILQRKRYEPHAKTFDRGTLFRETKLARFVRFYGRNDRLNAGHADALEIVFKPVVAARPVTVLPLHSTVPLGVQPPPPPPPPPAV